MTIDELKAMSLGYLTGADLLRFCPFQLLNSQYTVDNNSLQQGATMAYAEIMGKLRTRYDLTNEISTVRGDQRETNLVRIVSILAVRCVLSNVQNLSEDMVNHFRWADSAVRDIRNEQMNLILPVENVQTASTAYLVPNSFNTLG